MQKTNFLKFCQGFLLTLVALVWASVSLITGTPQAHAQTFPKQAKTLTISLTGISETTLLTPASGSFNTILGVSMVQSGLQSNTSLLCGSDLVVKNYDKDLFFTPMQYLCGNTLKLVKTGAQDTSLTTITYFPGNIASSSLLATFDATLNELGSQSSKVLTTFAYFTAGDIAIVILLFILILLSLFGIFRRYV